jgi:hypothetical protein
MLRSVPGVELQGEHNGIMNTLMTLIGQFADGVSYTHSRRRTPTLSYAHRPVDHHGLKCMVQDMMVRILLGRDHFEVLSKSKVTKKFYHTE